MDVGFVWEQEMGERLSCPPAHTNTGFVFVLCRSQKRKVLPCKVTNMMVEVAMAALRRDWVSPASRGGDQP